VILARTIVESINNQAVTAPLWCQDFFLIERSRFAAPPQSAVRLASPHLALGLPGSLVAQASGAAIARHHDEGGVKGVKLVVEVAQLAAEPYQVGSRG
jgi:hypothetical protein